jgi:hypothetical protein
VGQATPQRSRRRASDQEVVRGICVPTVRYRTVHTCKLTHC